VAHRVKVEIERALRGIPAVIQLVELIVTPVARINAGRHGTHSNDGRTQMRTPRDSLIRQRRRAQDSRCGESE
jgi:hypothetical protein